MYVEVKIEYDKGSWFPLLQTHHDFGQVQQLHIQGSHDELIAQDMAHNLRLNSKYMMVTFACPLSKMLPFE